MESTGAEIYFVLLILKMKTYDFAYGRGRKEFSIDESLVIKEVRTEEFTPMSDIKQGVLDAIYNPNYNANELLDRKMAEYAAAVCADRPCFHISLVQDISPNCDCHGENDAPILPDIGMFASFDPVAIDLAAADAVNAMPANPRSALSEAECRCHDHFINVHPNTNWRVQIEHGEEIGLGSSEYELIRI